MVSRPRTTAIDAPTTRPAAIGACMMESMRAARAERDGVCARAVGGQAADAAPIAASITPANTLRLIESLTAAGEGRDRRASLHRRPIDAAEDAAAQGAARGGCREGGGG